MHGPGYAPPPPPRPSRGGLITLRVLFVTMAVLSCGFLAWVCMLRLAVVTRGRRDWIAFTVSVAHIVLVVLILGTDPGVEEFTTWRGDVGMSLLLAGVPANVAYYLYAEIRHFGGTASAAYAHPHLGTTAVGRQGYGYPAPPPPPPQPQPQPYMPAQPTRQPPVPSSPRTEPQAHPQRPAPARIDQVRAELDELSDYLRRQEGDR
ncbi:hypothetical protein GCM10010145_36720 [Streptomyces ruber]|uniref:Integral membrane protein n=2 Tax=Streptomyces TaxID=1883 RepID=A0A918BEK6_9ACTN|nr:hypothetical protein [Streptomyces ruber]GGQ63504.1 hypothetical protein GCM10010145_36720 [Streptomyces ruber]